MSKQQEAPGELETVRRFVNTVDIERGEEQLESGPRLAAWLADNGLAPSGLTAGAADLHRALAVREALRAVLLANNGSGPAPEAAWDALDAAARRARVELRFTAPTGPRLDAAAEGVDGALGRVLEIVHGAVADGTWTRMKACRDHDCAWAFYDHSRNRSGAWCNMEVCGNRAKARAFRDRRPTPGVSA